MKRITVIIDTLPWAFGSHYKDLRRQFPQFAWQYAVNSGNAKHIPEGSTDAVYSLACWWAIDTVPPERCLLSVRSTRQYDKSFYSRYPGGLAQFLRDNYGRVTGLSETICNELHPFWPKVEHLPNGIDTERFQPAPGQGRNGKLVVGWAGWTQGRTRGWKRLEMIEQAVAETDHCELRVAEYNTPTYVPWELVHEWYQGLDVYVCASSGGEGSNRSTLEAMACGVPVISAVVGEAAFLVRDGDTGMRFDGTLEDLKAKIAQMQDDKARRDMGHRARQLIEGERSWRRVRPRYEQIFEELLSE